MKQSSVIAALLFMSLLAGMPVMAAGGAGSVKIEFKFSPVCFTSSGSFGTLSIGSSVCQAPPTTRYPGYAGYTYRDTKTTDLSYFKHFRVITDVKKNSPADLIGLEPGDIVLGIADGAGRFYRPEEMKTYFSAGMSGVLIVIKRDSGRMVGLPITLTDHKSIDW